MIKTYWPGQPWYGTKAARIQWVPKNLPKKRGVQGPVETFSKSYLFLAPRGFPHLTSQFSALNPSLSLISKSSSWKRGAIGERILKEFWIINGPHFFSTLVMPLLQTLSSLPSLSLSSLSSLSGGFEWLMDLTLLDTWDREHLGQSWKEQERTACSLKY